MPKMINKVITYEVKVKDESGKYELLDNTSDLQLPSIEKLSDTLKGAGILGEVDMPTFGQLASMIFAINNRADNGQFAKLSRPGQIDFMVVWVNDMFDSSGGKIGMQTNKVFMSGVNKKYDLGKIDVGSGADGSSEFEIYNLTKIVDGKTVLRIEKFNYVYEVNGVDYAKQIKAALQ